MPTSVAAHLPTLLLRVERRLGQRIGSLQWISDSNVPRFPALSETFLQERGYKSQLGQDFLVDALLSRETRQRVFVDVGAHDGQTLSNTHYLETVRGWSGLCIEPNPVVFARLKQNRQCACENVAIAEVAGTAQFTQVSGDAEMLSGVSSQYEKRHRRRLEREADASGGHIRDITVAARPLQSVLRAHNIKQIDFLSIDTEGSELQVLKSLDFRKTLVRIIAIERNYSSRGIPLMLRNRGFHRVFSLEWDDIYLNQDLGAFD